MTSELATNTLHAQANIEFDGAGAWPIAGAPELWIYLRRAAGRWELAVKVFDSLSGWKNDLAPEPGTAGADAVSGRGLGVVAGLSAGRWGQHLTRSRFGGWKVPGKAVWFALAVPGSVVPEPLRRTRLAPGRAARALEEMLAEHELGSLPPRPGAVRWHVGALGPLRADRVVPRECDLVAVPGRAPVRAGTHQPGRGRRADRLFLCRDRTPRASSPGTAASAGSASPLPARCPDRLSAGSSPRTGTRPARAWPTRRRTPWPPRAQASPAAAAPPGSPGR